MSRLDSIHIGDVSARPAGWKPGAPNPYEIGEPRKDALAALYRAGRIDAIPGVEFWETRCSGGHRKIETTREIDWASSGVRDERAAKASGRLEDTGAGRTAGAELMYLPIAYEWGLAGPDGAWFELLVEPHHNEGDVRYARHWLRNNHDVVSIKIVRVP
jgi:hypothetical protein